MVPTIVGGGVTGLTLAGRWAQDGREFNLLEREPVLGGLARSVRVKDFFHDLGPHRLFAHDPTIMKFITDILEGDFDWVERKTSFILYGRNHVWPTSKSIIATLPWKELVRIGFDLMLRSRREVDNFEDFISTRYGPRLLDLFFRPITEKFFRLPCKLLHKDWAEASMDRAIIEKYQHMGTLYYLIARTLLPLPPFRFIYPRTGGIQTFPDRLAAKCQASPRARLLRGAEVTGIEIKDQEIRLLTLSNGEKLEVDFVVWTGPIDRLYEMVTSDRSPLSFISTFLAHLILKSAPPTRDQWVYIPEEKYRITRISYPANFLGKPDPGHRGMCVEASLSEEEARGISPDRLFARVVSDLTDLKVISGPQDIEHRQTMVVPDSYPVYTYDYPANLRKMLLDLGRVRNLFVLGRSGMFWYNNMDNSIAAGLSFYDWLAGLDQAPDAEAKAEWVLRGRQTF